MTPNFKGQGIPPHPRPDDKEPAPVFQPFVVPTPKGEKLMERSDAEKA